MRPSRETRVALDALPDPVFVTETSGAVAFANRVARARFGSVACLDDLVGETSRAALARLLLSASGSTTPLPGSVALRSAGRIRIAGNLLVPGTSAGSPLVLVRFALDSADRFGALTAQVDKLNEEIRRRRHVESRLREALSERELMARELHHRVKNNVQMIVGMIAAARREAADASARDILAAAERRLAAVAVAQRMLYLGEGLAGRTAASYLAEVVRVVLDAHGGGAQNVEGDSSHMDNDHAVPLALIVNELVANALKHAPGEPFSLRLTGNERYTTLVVSDSGPGFDPGEMRRGASGLGLVRGLVRQIGGSVRIERDGGSRIVVELRRALREGDVRDPK